MTKPILDASDALCVARDFVRAIEMATRGAGDSEASALNAVCFAAEAKLDEALGLLRTAVKGEAA